MYRMPCLFINKKTKKDNTYKIADFLISESLQTKIYKHTLSYSTIIDTPKVKEEIGYNDDWSYKYDFDKAKQFNQELNANEVKNGIAAVKKSYELFKNINTDNFFCIPSEYEDAIRVFVIREVYKIVDNPNYDEVEFNKNADEFITNFNVKYN